MMDVAIIGGGPAALTAALYLARAGRAVKVFDRQAFGGELLQIAKIANYPGYEGEGAKLAEKFRKQAEQAGAELAYGECTKIVPATCADGTRADGSDERGFELTIDGEAVRARTVLVATGSEPKTLGFQITPPVSYCVLCDGDFAKGKHVAVVGGGNAAAHGALQLAPLAHSIDLITHSALKADAVLQRALERQPNISIREQLEPTREMLDTFDYVFVCIGRRPATKFLEPLATQTLVNKKTKLLDLEVTRELDLLDADGYVITGTSKHCSAHETAVPGLFAAGDVRSGMLRQVVTATGDGATAATEISAFLR